MNIVLKVYKLFLIDKNKYIDGKIIKSSKSIFNKKHRKYKNNNKNFAKYLFYENIPINMVKIMILSNKAW